MPAESLLQANLKPEISLEPSWRELWARIRRLGPYLWPKNDRWLQSLAVSFKFLWHTCGRRLNDVSLGLMSHYHSFWTRDKFRYAIHARKTGQRS